MTKLIRFPLEVGQRIAAAADREHRTFTGQVLHWLLKGEEAEGRRAGSDDAEPPPAA
jgi:hypothetical protein